jgi:hypothetical protein
MNLDQIADWCQAEDCYDFARGLGFSHEEALIGVKRKIDRLRLLKAPKGS